MLCPWNRQELELTPALCPAFDSLPPGRLHGSLEEAGEAGDGQQHACCGHCALCLGGRGRGWRTLTCLLGSSHLSAALAFKCLSSWGMSICLLPALSPLMPLPSPPLFPLPTPIWGNVAGSYLPRMETVCLCLWPQPVPCQSLWLRSHLSFYHPATKHPTPTQVRGGEEGPQETFCLPFGPDMHLCHLHGQHAVWDGFFMSFCSISLIWLCLCDRQTVGLLSGCSGMRTLLHYFPLAGVGAWQLAHASLFGASLTFLTLCHLPTMPPISLLPSLLQSCDNPRIRQDFGMLSSCVYTTTTTCIFVRALPSLFSVPARTLL